VPLKALNSHAATAMIAKKMLENLESHLTRVIGADALEIATEGTDLSTTCARNKLNIVSFDGQKVLKNITEIKQDSFPGAADLWDYKISAFSNQSGHTFFAQMAGWELAGMHIKESSQTEKVEMQTVDSWSQNMERVDILKIDTEGHDLLVISGALETLAHKVTVLAFEVGHEHKTDGSPTFENIVKQLDTLNFKCYITTMDAKAPILSTGCFYGDQGKGIFNVYCMHTVRGERIHKTFAYLANEALTPTALESIRI